MTSPYPSYLMELGTVSPKIDPHPASPIRKTTDRGGWASPEKMDTRNVLME